MGFLDRLTGRGKKKAEEAPVEEATSSPNVELMHDTAPSTSGHAASSESSYGPPAINTPSLSGGPAMINSASLPTALPDLSMSGASVPGTPATRLYDPYAGMAAVGGKKMFELPQQPEFVFEEEASVRRRGWTENLQFYTGAGYLAGAGLGVTAGLYSYATVKSEIPLDSWKLKANRLLNLAGSRAKPLSNGCGMLGLYFASIESGLANQVDLPGVPDSFNTVVAGALSGALFRSVRGPKQAAAAALVGAVGGVGMVGLRTIFPSL